MKTTYLYLVTAILAVTSVGIHSQSKPAPNSGTALIQIKAANESLITRQTATLAVLKVMETDSDQMRIIAKRK